MSSLSVENPKIETTKNNNNNNNHARPKHEIVNDKENKIKKKRRRDKSDLGPNFIAPDGGWGWLVAIASGVNVLVTFAVGQQFGIIFRDHMAALGISNSQLTTIINTQIAVSAFTGLLNGPLFRRFTYRQVALVGSFLTFLGLFVCVFANTFLFYIVSYSCCYGFGRGLTVSASSLAVNTYFKVKRRTATAYQFGVAGLGPIVLPYLATFLLYLYGVQGTVLIFSAIALHTIACSLIYQPVRWNLNGMNSNIKPKGNIEDEQIEQFVKPETPILPRSNEGWYGSKSSLNSARLNPWTKQFEAGAQIHELKQLNPNTQRFSDTASIMEMKNEQTVVDSVQCKVSSKNSKHLNIVVDGHLTDDHDRKKLPFYKKVVIFFDLDLLRDITYVNLAFGLTLINFVEVNFAILTPFILSDFGFSNNQIAFAMSSLGLCDLVIRFLIPLITAKMHFSNQTFFVIGIIGMCLGRALLASTRDFYVMLAAFIWMGLNKAFRTVFWSLIIAGYVPLKRLPAASGLQLLMSGVFSMVCGPLIGLIRDSTNYSFTLNFLNGLCIFAISMWTLESLIRKRLGSKPRTCMEVK